MVNWDEIDTVLLDMDGTLLDLHFDNFFWLQHLPEKYAEHHGLTPEVAWQTLSAQMQDKVGQLEWYCLDYWSQLTGLSIVELKREVQHKIQFRPHVPDFLRALRAAGKRSVIVTNAHRDSVDLKMQHTGLDKLVDHIISSHDYQYPKEEQAFWHTLMEQAPFELNATLLIDDSVPVLESAQRFGFQHLLSICQPDSQKPKRHIHDFKALDHFSEIMPRASEKPDD
ncbi:MAG: GMP/IMP nucleotidase [Bermanella sp.]|jgi:haloacid dehalogenase superfamily, subfamily IA, variant 3 with third motif having DD or ED